MHVLKVKVIEIAIYIEDLQRKKEGYLLAKQLGVPIISTENVSEYPIILVLTQQRLELQFPQEKLKPIFVDFFAKSTLYRLQQSTGRNELIAKAVGIKGSFRPSIIDATAGLGGDSLVLAHLGCQVQMVERSLILCALLKDALLRAERVNSPWISQLTLVCEEAKTYLKRQIDSNCFVDVVYLDPMFPERTKTALVKKEMRILKKIVGQDEDASQLFCLAMQCAKKRVVIKRSLHADPLIANKISMIYKGKACRFDVYQV